MKYFISAILIFFFVQNHSSAGLVDDITLAVSSIEEIRFSSGEFEIVGNLYLPQSTSNQNFPLVIWVSGSGPSFRTVKSKQTIRLINCFLAAGIAYFRIDKPGSGDSKGELNDEKLFDQLSQICVDAINVLKLHPKIDANFIGLFGSSQAGYIMPLAASKTSDIKFIMGSSCPGENSIDQWNYLLEKQMLCEGIDSARAAKNIKMFSLLRLTDSKDEFDNAIGYFENNPMIVRSLNYDSTFAIQAKNWWPRVIDEKDELHFNPITVIEKLTIPIFMVYGDKDTQINPFQAIDAYNNALQKAGNNFYRIELINGVDHNMCPSNSGCLNEIAEQNRSGIYSFSEKYYDVIKNWISMLIEHYNNAKSK
jgi:dipeptidyl aminopeptidase/acylaminoacyl peptidase